MQIKVLLRDGAGTSRSEVKMPRVETRRREDEKTHASSSSRTCDDVGDALIACCISVSGQRSLSASVLGLEAVRSSGS